MGWAGFTLDAPISLSAAAYDKMYRSGRDYTKLRKGIPLPTKPKDKSTSFFGSLRKAIRTSTSQLPTLKASSNLDSSPILRLPLAVRKRIYGYVVGQDEVLHVLLKRKAGRKGYCIRYRRCRAAGKRDDCAMFNCRPGLDVVNGIYHSGSSDSSAGLLLTCRDIYEEVLPLLYAQNSFDFDHPLSLVIFTLMIAPFSLQSICSITLELGKHLYDPKSGVLCKSFHMSQWAGCWEIIARMEGLEKIRVRFGTPLSGWLGMSERENLEPLWIVDRKLSVFEVEAPGRAEMGLRWIEAPFTLESGERPEERGIEDSGS